MPEKEVVHRFRGHHAPSNLFVMLDSLKDQDRDIVVGGFYKSNEWGISREAGSIRNFLYGSHMDRLILHYLDLSRKTDEHSRDIINGEMVQSRAFMLATTRVDDINFLLSRDSDTTIMVGLVVDNFCRQCVVGNHCREVTEGETDDTRLAVFIKQSCDALGIECELGDSPDGLMERDERGGQCGKVATLSLGSFRDFLLRRLIYFEDYRWQLERSLRKICPKEMRFEEFRELALVIVKVEADEEIALQRRIDDARRSVTF